MASATNKKHYTFFMMSALSALILSITNENQKKENYNKTLVTEIAKKFTNLDCDGFSRKRRNPKIKTKCGGTTLSIVKSIKRSGRK
jgi:hypothetical protein